jgi:hypothetical protein
MRNPAMLAAVLALGVLGDDAEARHAKMNAEEWKAHQDKLKQRTAAAKAARQAEYDAIAQPYREARRARKAAYLARQRGRHWNELGTDAVGLGEAVGEPGPAGKEKP